MTAPAAPSPAGRADLPPARREWRFWVTWLFPPLVVWQAWSAPAWALGSTLLTWAVVAAADAWLPGAQRSPPPCQPHPLHRWALRGYVPLQIGLQAAVGWRVAQGGLDGLTIAGLAFAVGWLAGAIGITYAHELGHRPARVDRALAWLLMGSVGYSHFMVEHYRGHHPRAATRADPASARRGESVYAFLPRTLLGGWRSAWRLHAARQRERGWPVWTGALPAWTVGTALALSALALAGAAPVLAFWAGQALVATCLLEIVNYIEHYGLQRRVTDGSVEPFGYAHAWNADHAWSNALLANLQRHSDHHQHAHRPYPTLRPAAAPAPQLPTGYAGCVLLALVPPLWFARMHPRLDALGQTG